MLSAATTSADFVVVEHSAQQLSFFSPVHAVLVLTVATVAVVVRTPRRVVSPVLVEYVSTISDVIVVDRVRTSVATSGEVEDQATYLVKVTVTSVVQGLELEPGLEAGSTSVVISVVDVVVVVVIDGVCGTGVPPAMNVIVGDDDGDGDNNDDTLESAFEETPETSYTVVHGETLLDELASVGFDSPTGLLKVSFPRAKTTRASSIT